MSNLKPTSGLLDRVPGVTRAWQFLFGGASIETPSTMIIRLERTPGDPSTRLGQLEYGAEPNPDGSPSKYDTFIFHEMGGAVTLPFTIVDGAVFVAVVEQRRFCEAHVKYNPSGKIENAPRGFHNVGATARQTATDELKTEVGVFEGETFRLPGQPFNANNSWFSYEDELGEDGASLGQGGAIPYAVRVNAALLEPVEGGRYRIKPDHLGERAKGSPYELIGRCTFVRWQTAVGLRDGFTAVAVARLLAYLETSGQLKL